MFLRHLYLPFFLLFFTPFIQCFIPTTVIIEQYLSSDCTGPVQVVSARAAFDCNTGVLPVGKCVAKPKPLDPFSISGGYLARCIELPFENVNYEPTLDTSYVQLKIYDNLISNCNGTNFYDLWVRTSTCFATSSISCNSTSIIYKYWTDKCSHTCGVNCSTTAFTTKANQCIRNPIFKLPIYAACIEPTSNTILIISIIAAVFAVLFVLCISFIVILLVVVLVKRKAKMLQYQRQIDEKLPLVDTTDLIEYNKLDFSKGDLIGSGAQGSIYLAYYFKTPVAVKMYSRTLYGMDMDLSDFYTEFQCLKKYSLHPNIVRFIGVVQNKQLSQVGIVMEYCSEGNLAQYIEKHQLTSDQKMQILFEIANAMSFLHSQNMLHRDLKPENILLDSTLHVKLSDFGMSRELASRNHSALTNNIGTAAYMAPEVISDTKQLYTNKVDVYSFGIVCWVVLHNSSKPYGENNNFYIIQQVQKSSFRPKPSPQIKKDFKDLVKLMEKCWHSQPTQRPTFDQICTKLEVLQVRKRILG